MSRLVIGVVAVALAAGAVVGVRLAPAAREPAAAPVAECTGVAAIDYACLERRYLDLVYGRGVAAAFGVLREELATSGFVRVACHDLTHVIGHAAGDVYGDVMQGFADGDPLCAGGYYHGVTGAVVAHRGAALLEQPQALCAELATVEQGSFRHYSCVHGLGHGFLGLERGDVPAALGDCDRLATAWERDTCYGGVFIENVGLGATGGDPGAWLDPAEPLYPCTTLAPPYSHQCYEKQAGYALYLADNDYTAVFEACGGVPTHSRASCHEGIGASAAAHAVKYVTGDETQGRAAVGLCGLGGDQLARDACLEGAVRNVVHYFSGTREASALCAASPAGMQALCRRALEAERFD